MTTDNQPLTTDSSAEGEGLEPPRVQTHPVSSGTPYQLGLALLVEQRNILIPATAVNLFLAIISRSLFSAPYFLLMSPCSKDADCARSKFQAEPRGMQEEGRVARMSQGRSYWQSAGVPAAGGKVMPHAARSTPGNAPGVLLFR